MSARRRAVALSPQDRERIARGELPEADAEVERRRGRDALTEGLELAGGAVGPQDDGDAVANDARLLREVPPHWG